ncbi:DMT family transporter [Brevibacillus sp. H7]|uniref:DMT family transporter n=1 Tax=Brevibacillus sp. H7 TaxID=3349138 RepID=UPI0037F325B6
MWNNKSLYALPLIAALFWGGNFVAGRAALDELPPFSLSFLRWSIALLVLLPFTWRGIVSEASFYRSQWKEISFLGLLGIAAFTPLVYLSILHTSTINAAMLAASSPMMIVLMAFVLLGDRISGRQLAGFIVSLMGVLWIVSKGAITQLGQFHWNTGDIIMLASNVIWALYSIRIRKADPRLTGMRGFTLSIAVSLLFLLPGTLWEVYGQGVLLFQPAAAWNVLYLGVFASVVSFLCWNKSIALLGPGKASPFLNFIPVFAALFSVLFLNERLQVAQAVGGMFILAGVYLSSLTKRSVPKVREQGETGVPQEVNA